MLKPVIENKMVLIENLRTIKDYAALRGITRQGVHKAIKNGWNLPDAEAVHKVGDKLLIEVKGREGQ